MKKITSTLLIILSLILVFTFSVSANNSNAQRLSTDNNSYVEYYNDGSYTITTTNTTVQSPVTRASTYVVTGERIVNLYNSSDELQWTYTLIGKFTVVYGESVVCTSSTYSYEIYNSSWSLTAHENTYRNNIASGTATFKKKVLFITTNTHNVDVEIGCDVYGNVG